MTVNAPSAAWAATVQKYTTLHRQSAVAATAAGRVCSAKSAWAEATTKHQPISNTNPQE